ncbi:DUF4062 domain-containing protein [Ferrovibrio sp.]|uniref:DUF4062 domain-containing protein n=1 Tax=Ferrovibrio sp. TaxID=1917215 RepID=UPI003D11E308
MNKKYQVFISSTFRDLAEERQAITKMILDLGHIPSGMELFPAADIEQFTYIKRVIDECDYYVLIIGARYGSVDNDGISFTEREYDYAVETGKTVLAFIHNDTNNIVVGKTDTAPEIIAKLEIFRSKVSTGRLVKFWNTRENLQAHFAVSFIAATSQFPAIGWIRGNAVASEDLLGQLNALRDQKDALTNEVMQLRSLAHPRLDGLAGIDDKFTITCNWTYTYHGNLRQKSEQVTMTWREIFIGACSQLVSPKTPEIVKISLQKYIAETHDYISDYAKITDAQFSQIKFHLMALGLTKLSSRQTVKGGLHEFMALTNAGTLRLQESLAVRKA